MTKTRILLKALLGLSLLAAACGAGPDADEAGGPRSSLTRSSVCAKTRCEKIFDDCQSYLNECFGQCNAMPIEYSFQCVSVCSNYQCSPCTVDDCVEHDYEFEISAPRNPEVFAACEGFRARSAGCGSDVTKLDCDRFARLERPEVAASYDCLASLACGADEASCAPAPTSWGLSFCLALNASCDYAGLGCTPAEAQQLDQAAAWLKDDVRAEAMKCLDESACSDVSACVNAWFATVFP